MASGVPALDRRSLPPGVELGEGSKIEQGAETFRRFFSTRRPGLKLGRSVRVYTWTTFSIEPAGVLQVGDESVLVGAAFMCGERIHLGNRVFVSYNVVIADSDFHPLGPELRRRDAVANAPEDDRSRRPQLETRPVMIDDDVWVGVGAIILKGVRVGSGASIGAGAVVTADVAPGESVSGNPARPTPTPP